MQRPSRTKSLRAKLTTTTPDYKTSVSGKLPNPYHHFTHIKSISKNTTEFICPQHNSIPPNELAHKSTNLPITTHRICNTYNQTNKSSNLLYKARLHAQKGGDKNTTLETYQNISNHCVQQMASRGKAVHDAIMRSPINTNMEDTEHTMVIETT